MNAKVLVLSVLIATRFLSAAVHTPDILLKVKSAVRSTTDEMAVVVFDLDDTLLDTRLRSFKIFDEASKNPELAAKFPEETKTLGTAGYSQVRYEVGDTLAGIGITGKNFADALSLYWSPRFFGPAAEGDEPVRGAVAYVKELQKQGAFLVYLTGRDAPGMYTFTENNLKRRGFPLGQGTRLMLKPQKSIPDIQFKKQAFEEIERHGKVVALFENEPVNINAMNERFPSAISIFVDLNHSNKPDRPNANVFWVKDYLANGE